MKFRMVSLGLLSFRVLLWLLQGFPPGLDDLRHLEDTSFEDEPPEGSGAFGDDH